MAESQAHIAAVTGYTITSMALVHEALDTTGLRAPQSNQRLAMVGDAALKAAILNEWYETKDAKGKWVSQASFHLTCQTILTKA